MKTHLFSALIVGVLLFFSSCSTEDLVTGDLKGEQVEVSSRYGFSTDLVPTHRFNDVYISPTRELSKYKPLAECSYFTEGQEVINSQNDLFIKITVQNTSNAQITLTRNNLQAWTYYSEENKRYATALFDENMVSVQELKVPLRGTLTFYSGFNDLFLNLVGPLGKVYYIEFGMMYNSKFIFQDEILLRWQWSNSGWD